MRKFLAGVAIACALVTVAPPAAQSATVNYSISFSSLMFPGIPGNTVSGSFDLQFDPTLSYLDSTIGITQNSLNVPVDSPIAFSYSPIAGGTLAIGGLENGAAFLSSFPFATDDFVLTISLLNVAPFALFVGQTFDFGNFGFLNVAYQTSLSVNDVTPVPVPAALVLFGSALAGFFGFGKLRKRFSAREPAVA